MKLITHRSVVLFSATCLVLVHLSVAAQEQQSHQKEQAATANQATTITMDQLEENPRSYIGKRITVEAEVEEILGPRLIAVDSPAWFDFDGDTLVFLHPPLAGLITDGARVTITGTMQPFVQADVEREWGWFDDQPDIEVKFKDRPVLVATSIKSERGLNLAIRMVPGQPSPATTGEMATTTAAEKGATGTTGATDTRSQAISDLSQLATADDRGLVGRDVSLSSARVARMAEKNGFWVSGDQGGEQLLVVPADGADAKVKAGQAVAIEGVVLQMPKAMQQRAEQAQQGNDEAIYVFASKVQASK